MLGHAAQPNFRPLAALDVLARADTAHTRVKTRGGLVRMMVMMMMLMMMMMMMMMMMVVVMMDPFHLELYRRPPPSPT